MSANPSGPSNAVPDLEILGEWDHGMMDPVFASATPATTSTDNNNNSSLPLPAKHHFWEGAVHAVEEMIHRGMEVQSCSDELTGVVDMDDAQNIMASKSHDHGQ